jgi:hypothetical protein
MMDKYIALGIGTVVFILVVIYMIKGQLELRDFERRLKESSNDGTVLNYGSPEELKSDKRYDKKR